VFDNIVARHRAFKRIEILAQRDVLTDLWSRAAFFQLIEDHLRDHGGGDAPIALIAIDLDRVKDINDTLGPPAGDTILKEAADRIRSAGGPHGEISRIGGDEFLVALTGTSAAGAHDTAQHILAKFAQPFTVQMTSSVCGASLGYAIGPANGST